LIFTIKGILLRVFARGHTEGAKGGSNGIATAFNSQLYDIFRVKIIGFFANDAPALCSIPWSMEGSKQSPYWLGGLFQKELEGLRNTCVFLLVG
jgi:hypothetical protein